MFSNDDDDLEAEYYRTTRRGRNRSAGGRKPRGAAGDGVRTRRGRLTDEERDQLATVRAEATAAALPGGADRWSTWDTGERGPQPYPAWLTTELAAVDHELGVLKTGKEADVHLLSRSVPHTSRSCLLAAKRYRNSDHRQFHRDAGYLEGRRMRRSRENRAMAARSAFGRGMIAQQWAVAEFTILCDLWSGGLPVPYPVQRVGTEVMLEFLGTTAGEPAPRLAELRPAPEELDKLWLQLVDALTGLAEHGHTHGDLSAYNVLVHEGRLMLIDLPQTVDLAANPAGMRYLHRDLHNIASWFRARGLPEDRIDLPELSGMLAEIARLV